MTDKALVIKQNLTAAKQHTELSRIIKEAQILELSCLLANSTEKITPKSLKEIYSIFTFQEAFYNRRFQDLGGRQIFLFSPRPAVLQIFSVYWNLLLFSPKITVNVVTCLKMCLPLPCFISPQTIFLCNLTMYFQRIYHLPC